MTDPVKWTDAVIMTTSILSMLAVFAALMVTAFIFYRTKQDIAEVAELQSHIGKINEEIKKSGYISDEIANVLYDLYELFAATKAYIELVDGGHKINDNLFVQINRRVSLIEKHFAELGLFSQDRERRRSVQLSLANMYGDSDTLKIMEKISSGKNGNKDGDIQVAIKMLKARIKANILYVDSSIWTGRPSGGSF